MAMFAYLRGLLSPLKTVIVDRRMDRWKKESERHQSRTVSIYMLPFGRLHTPRKDINKTNVFTKFHDDWATNVTSRETNVLTKFHENWAEIVTSKVFTCFHYIHIEKTAPPTGGHFHDNWAKIHVFQRTGIIFELNPHWTKNVTSENCPAPGGHAFSPIWTIFELV
ncbi:hypothetical protein DPMN_011340 [Dreissena polymorpha]|uniref:Uncharacterized protein n=1 Tax=Dreissena polymorpha TaxID=45954 RepID=A0A9D4RZW9_DREPO|nr:hypothetical protein DPMN_011340 [Dreissena polymorpha]